MTSRIHSQHGNVIAADFRPNGHVDLAVNFKSETLYCDEQVMIFRTTALLGDKPIVTIHHLGDLATGNIVQLNSKDAPR